MPPPPVQPTPSKGSGLPMLRRTGAASGIPLPGSGTGSLRTPAHTTGGLKRPASVSASASAPAPRESAEEQAVLQDKVFQTPLHSHSHGADENTRPTKRLHTSSTTTTTPGNDQQQQELATLRASHELSALQSSARTSELERQLLAQARQLERYQRERLEMLSEWESLQQSKQAREAESGAQLRSLQAELRSAREAGAEARSECDALAAQLEAQRLRAREGEAEKEVRLVRLRGSVEALEAEKQALAQTVEELEEEVDELRKVVHASRDPTMTLGRRVLQQQRKRRRKQSAKAEGEEGAEEADEEEEEEEEEEDEEREHQNALRNELKRQVAHLKKLEASNASLTADNARLQQQLSSIEVVREEKRSLESKLRHAELRAVELQRHELEAKALREEQSKWEAQLLGLGSGSGASDAAGGAGDQSTSSIAGVGAGGSDESDLKAALRVAEGASEDALDVSEAFAMPSRPSTLTRHTLPPYLSVLESTLRVSLSKVRGLLQLLQRAHAERDALEGEVVAAERRVLDAESAHSRARHGAERAELAEKRAREETARYKGLLDSFQAEQRIKKTSFDEANLQRIDVLQAQADEQRAANESLEQEIKRVRAECNQLEETLAQLRREAAAAAAAAQASSSAPTQASDEDEATAAAAYKQQVASLTAELEKLGGENERLWARVGRGEFDMERYRVLTLVGGGGGPLERARDLRLQRLEALKRENEQLLAKVDELSAKLGAGSGSASGSGASAEGGGESAEAAAANPLARAMVDNLRLEIRDLQVSIAAKDKAMLRLKEVFSAKAAEFTGVVQCLFGWKLRFMDSGKVKLTSAFSKSKRKTGGGGTTLIFRSRDGNVGDMVLTGEALREGLADVQGLSDKWLRQDALYSIPCFLAEMNQQLFESCTRARVFFGTGPEEEEDEEE